MRTNSNRHTACDRQEAIVDSVESKAQTKMYSTVDKDSASHKTFGAVVTHFGGWSWQPAIVGARNHCIKCVAMGGDWAYVDKMSGLMFFFIVEKKWEGTFEQKWQSFKKHIGDTTGAQETKPEPQAALPSHAFGSGGTPSRMHPSPNAETAEGAPAARRAAAAAARKVAAVAVKTGPKSAAALPSDPCLKVVVKLKPLLTNHRLAAQTLLSKIASQDAFKWANNPETRPLEVCP